MSIRAITDLAESYDGDLIIEGGDLKDTSANTRDTYAQLIRTILATPSGDSSLFKNMGFDADIYEGAVNNERTGKDLARAIKDAIVFNTMLYPAEVGVIVFPIGAHTVVCRIVLNPIGEPTYEYTTTYDTSDKMIRSFVFADGSTREPVTLNVEIPPVINSRA